MGAVVELPNMVWTEAESLVCFVAAFTSSSVRAQGLEECAASVNVASGVKCGDRPG